MRNLNSFISCDAYLSSSKTIFSGHQNHQKHWKHSSENEYSIQSSACGVFCADLCLRPSQIFNLYWPKTSDFVILSCISILLTSITEIWVGIIVNYWGFCSINVETLDSVLKHVHTVCIYSEILIIIDVESSI